MWHSSISKMKSWATVIKSPRVGLYIRNLGWITLLMIWSIITKQLSTYPCLDENCPRIHYLGDTFWKYSGGGCPQTPLSTVSAKRKYALAAKPSTQNPGELEEKCILSFSGDCNRKWGQNIHVSLLIPFQAVRSALWTCRGLCANK